MQSYSSKYNQSITWYNKSKAIRMRIYNKYRRWEWDSSIEK